MIVWTNDDIEYKGYKLNQIIEYKQYITDSKYKKGRIIGFNLDSNAIFPVFIEPELFGTSFLERKCWIEKSSCIFTNNINIMSCKFNNIDFDNIKSFERFTVRELKKVIGHIPDNYEVRIGIDEEEFVIDNVMTKKDNNIFKIICKGGLR